MDNEAFDIAAQVYKNLIDRFSQERIFSFYQSEKDKIIKKSHIFEHLSIDLCSENKEFLTDGLAYLFYTNRLISGDVKRFYILNNPLNSNFKKIKIAIYANTSATTKTSSTNFCLNSIFDNLRFYDLSKYEKNKIEISVNVIDSNDTNKEIDIYFVPYPKVFTPKPISDENKISFEERKEIDQLDATYLKRLSNVIDSINFNRISIIFSPEMVGSTSLNKKIEELISLKIPSLVVCPSFHKIEDSRFLNQSLIFYKNDFSYESIILNKVFPAKLFLEELNLEVTENLSILETYKIHIFHIANIGTVMVVICIDFDKQCIDDLIDDVLPDLVLVESYTPNYKFFAEKAFSFASHNIFCLLGNACSMCKDNKHYLVGYAPCIGKTSAEPAEPVYFGSINDKQCSDCINDYNCYKKITFRAKYDEKFGKIILKFKEESNE